MKWVDDQLVLDFKRRQFEIARGPT